MFTPEETKALLKLIAKVQGGVKDVMFLALLASAAMKLEASLQPPPPDAKPPA